ncbi:MAG: hypothetical protein U0694_04265 [Anaerolineae bacterium]
MKLLRRILLLVSLGTLLVSAVLLLNFTAPNPSGRRYSSQIPSLTSRGRDGSDAERILALDLGVPQNTVSPPRQCICNSRYSAAPPGADCDVCSVLSDNVSNYRIPDFVTDTYIAEAKNYAPNNDVYSSNREQLDAFMAMAAYLERPLWLYVAVDSRVSPEFQYLVEQTGGGIVLYFTVPGYADPVDEAARKGVAVSGLVFALGILGEAMSLRRGAQKSPAKPPAPKQAKAPRDPMDKVAQAMQRAEHFTARKRETLRRKIERDDTDLEKSGDE